MSRKLYLKEPLLRGRLSPFFTFSQYFDPYAHSNPSLAQIKLSVLKSPSASVNALIKNKNLGGRGRLSAPATLLCLEEMGLVPGMRD